MTVIKFGVDGLIYEYELTEVIKDSELHNFSVDYFVKNGVLYIDNACCLSKSIETLVSEHRDQPAPDL